MNVQPGREYINARPARLSRAHLSMHYVCGLRHYCITVIVLRR